MTILNSNQQYALKTLLNNNNNNNNNNINNDFIA